jgi:hypothetical protein
MVEIMENEICIESYTHKKLYPIRIFVVNNEIVGRCEKLEVRGTSLSKVKKTLHEKLTGNAGKPSPYPYKMVVDINTDNFSIGLTGYDMNNLSLGSTYLRPSFARDLYETLGQCKINPYIGKGPRYRHYRRALGALPFRFIESCEDEQRLALYLEKVLESMKTAEDSISKYTEVVKTSLALELDYLARNAWSA